MALLLLSTVILGFVLFFYGIGLRYLAFIPLIFLAMFFGYYGATKTIKTTGTEVLQKYSLYVAWIIIMAGLVGVFNFFGMDLINSALGLLSLNLLLRIASQLFNYQDGKSVFQIGFYFCIAMVLIISLALGGRGAFYNVFCMLWVMHLGITAFFIFLVGLQHEPDQYMWYKLGVLSIGTIFLVVFDQIKNIYLALTINSLLLTGLYYLVYKVFQFRPVSDEKKKNVSVRRILAGERINAPKKVFTSKTIEVLYSFMTAMPGWTKQVLELFNIILILILILTYIMHMGDFALVNHLLYRAVIATFVVNVYFLKKVGYNSILQNLVVFLVINFAIYVSLFSYFNGDVGAVVSRGIIRNIVSSSMIFYAHKVPMLAKIFSKTDYMYRIVASIGAMIVNVILLINTELPGELIFFLVLVYVGLQSMIIYYAAKYLGKIQNLN
ncbi:MAG: hypothetical protein NT085_00295 [candidate division SR1 bacterium]|nr:hypothetical protein [candidate division SR1 bacterium]